MTLISLLYTPMHKILVMCYCYVCVMVILPAWILAIRFGVLFAQGTFENIIIK